MVSSLYDFSPLKSTRKNFLEIFTERTYLGSNSSFDNRYTMFTHKTSAKAARMGVRCISNAAKPTFQIKNPSMREAVLEGYSKFGGPPSLKSRTTKLRYNTPIGLDEAFPLAHEIVKAYQADQYKKIEELQKKLETTTKSKDIKVIKKQITKASIKAEIDNPEVKYNFKIGYADFNEPVYRHLAEQKWKDYDLLILMQRLETLKVIPDTMPTLEPRANVEIQFPGFVNKWLTPGDVIPCGVATRPPVVKIQEYKEISENSLYTLVIVDPDTPDLATDSYTTTLKWAVSNIPLSNVNAVVDTEKATELMPYLPPTPEKNSGIHRHAVWAFRQTNGVVENVDETLLTRENFNIRKFAEELKLDAVGAHIWRSKFDRTSEALREKYGLAPGRVFTRVRR